MTSRSVQSTDDNYPDDRIAALLERHGNAIRNNQPLRMEDLLLEVQPEYRSEFLIELLMQELELRQPPPVRDQARREFRDRFPEYLSAVSAALRQWRPEPAPADTVPVWIGKYKVIELLGTGSFATVYLADNPGLNRKVALKVPLTRPPEHDLDPDFDEAAREREEKRYKRELELFRKKMDQYRREARLLAEMDDPALVRIYDIFDSEHEVPILVQEFVEGPDLRQYLKQRYREPGRHVPIPEAIQLIMAICEGLAVAHQKEIYHRDLKPANILLDKDGKPKIADFGLALHASQLHSRANLVEGTLAYMAPEQIDGQTPRIDGRSDLWAVGVMLYEMVAGQHPFRWEYSSSREILRDRIRQSILESDPTPLHQLREDVPEELDRICRRCLQPQKDKRFDSIRRLSEDLAALAAQISGNSGRPPVSMAPPSAPAPGDASSGSTSPGSSTAAEPPQLRQPLKVSPRGLLSFTGAEQAEFLQLLPGVPDRHGLPPAVAFWKHRIEAGGLVRPFAVGLLYGPSGCGKTSLMRAGILPRLSPNVRAHYVEATAADTEVRILKDLRTTWKDLPQVDLPEMLRRIREQGQWLPLGHRLLVVVDQFEQWLHANHSFPQQQLTSALAQCDGARVQVILMIREEFIPLAEQFFSQLSIPLDANHNRFRLDLFDQSHARRVLTLFGVAQGHLPENASANTKAQNQFLKEAIKQLSSERGEVISVHLALFVEMFGNREWTPERLREVGGVERLGVRFLEDSFRREENRRYSLVAQRLLQALLPQEGSSDTDETPRIKGAMRSRKQLQQAAGMEHQGDEFDRLMDKLEKTLRLITPTTPDGITATPAAAQADRYYQLTHDYLVPAVTDWIKQKQRETRSGQAELKLAERTSAWQRKKERRQLPSLQEWIQIRWHVPRRRWTEMQRQMMSVAGVWHLVQSAIASTVLMILLCSGLLLYSNTLVENVEQLEVAGLVDAARDMQPVRFIVGPLLERKQQTAVANKNKELATKTLLMRLPLGAVSLSEGDLQLLQDAVTAAKPADLVHLTSLLQPVNRDLVPRLQVLLENSGEPATKRLNAACVLAGLATDKQTPWSRKSTSEFVVGELFSIAKQAPATIADYERAIRAQAAHWVPIVADTIAATPVSEEVTPGIWQLLTLDGDVRNQAVDYLKTELMRVPSPWNDPPLKLEWTQPERMQELTSAVAAAKGILNERSGFCLDMRLSQFRILENSFRASGYRPTRVRPHAGPADEDPRLAVVWVRDGLKWKLDDSVPLAELPARDANVVLDEFVLSDIAYVAGHGSHSGWLLLWSARLAEEDERHYIAGETEEKFQDSAERYAAAGFKTQATISVYNDPDGVRRYSGVFWKSEELTNPRFQITPDDLEERLLTDIAVAASPELSQPPDPRARYRKELIQLLVSEENLQDANIRFQAAVARFHTNQEEAALGDLDWLIKNHPTRINPGMLFVYQAVALARLQRHDEAAAAMNRLQKTSLDQSYRDYVAIQLAAWRKDVQVATEMLDKAETEYGADPNRLYDMVCAAALASEAFGQLQLPEQQAKFRTRALQILKNAIEMPKGYSDLSHMLQDVDLAQLHDQPEFLAIAKQVRGSFELATLIGGDYATRVTTAASLHDLRSKLQSDQDWRPGSVAVDLVNGSPIAILLERRPRLTETQQEQLSARRSGMATAFLKLNSRQLPADILADNPANIADPTLRNLVPHRIPLFGVLVPDLLAQIETSLDPGIRRAAIQGLGELAQRKLLTPDEQGEVGSQVIRFHADRDPGVHSAAAWTLRQLGVEPPASGGSAEWKIDDGPFWERRRFGSVEMEFAVIDGRKERGSGIVSDDEVQRPFNIGRCYEIGLYEVSEKNYAASLLPEESAKFFDGQTPSDRPAGVSWYQAAEYCNWLSEQHGFPSDQWCYEGTKPFGNGLKLKKNWRDLPGYRLPSEAEWEFACRAGTETEYSCGDNPKLLADYGWYDISAVGLGGPFVVGQKRPNRYGLFDVHGNVWEWCQDPDVRGQAGGPEESDELIKYDTARVLRGGSFDVSATNVRSAYRYNYRPDLRFNVFGFRVSRTYPLPP